MDLKNRWFALASKYSSKESLLLDCWNEIEFNYTERGRAYHNCTHIESMLSLMDACTHDWEQKDVTEMSIWYHDVIYNARKGDNEFQSAVLAKKRLTKLGFSEAAIDLCYSQILATKSHTLEANHTCSDTAYLLDFDLEVLGRDWESYELYSQQIRKEYSIYPWFMYKRGRKKAMEHFLERPFIYQTNNFRERLEAQARKNIRREIGLLT